MNPNSDRSPFPDMRVPGSAEGAAANSEHAITERKDASIPQELAPVPPQHPPMAGDASFVNPTLLAQPTAAIPVGQPMTQASPDQKKSAPLNEDATIKEAIAKAKGIIAQTKHDPYIETTALSKVKAEFIKKQYGKDIKVSEG